MTFSIALAAIGIVLALFFGIAAIITVFSFVLMVNFYLFHIVKMLWLYTIPEWFERTRIGIWLDAMWTRDEERKKKNGL